MTDTKIVKVVVPSFGLKGAFERVDLNRKEFETLQEDYLAEQLALLETISTRDIDRIHSETARMLLDKMIPPLQYWLENKFACNRLNTGATKPADPHTKKVLEQAAKQAKAKKFADRIDTDFDPLEQTGSSHLPGSADDEQPGKSYGPPNEVGKL